MQSAPFVFGKIAEFENFTNREEETELLKNQFLALNNVIVISPRRWGKTSLIKHVTTKLEQQNENYKVVHLDMFNVRSEEEFYEMFATKILKINYSKIETIIEKSKSLFSKIIPKISFNPIPESEFSLSFDWEEVKKNPSEILDLPQKIAEKENIKIIVCIDEFQNLQVFKDALSFQKKLRANWQHHNGVSYCLYGSQENMMQTFFNSPKLPFYRFAYILNLEKIKINKWATFITTRFADTSKKIDEKEAILIVNLVENLPFYVQQLAQITWFLTDKKASIDIVKKAFANLLEQLNPFFVRETEHLTTNQIKYLKLLIENIGPENTFYNIEKYGLNSTANMAVIKKALVEKQILRKNQKVLEFIDPIFKVWLKETYFRTQY
jgi:uncharacterized protein